MANPTLARRLQAADSWSLRAITGGAMVFAVIGLVSLVLRVVYLLGSKVVDVAGISLNPYVTIPELADSPHVEAAHYETAVLSVADAPGSARAWLVAEAASSSLLFVGLCVIVAILGMKLFVGRPFARTATFSIMAASILVIATGSFGQLFSAIARAEIVQYLGDAGGVFALFMINFDPAPFGFGFALAIIAGAFQLGERLQRDAEGLI